MVAGSVILFLTLILSAVYGARLPLYSAELHVSTETRSDYMQMLYQSARSNVENVRKALMMHSHGNEELVDDIVEALEEDAPCTECKALIELVKLIAAPEWNNETSSNWTQFCSDYLLAIDNTSRTDIYCPGVIKVYGPHVHRILVHADTSVTVDAYCEMLNFCIPPENPSPPKTKKMRRSLTREEVLLLKHNNPPGQGKNPPIHFVQLADIHVDPKYDEGAYSECGLSVCCRFSYGGQGSAARPWGEYTCNVPERTMEQMIKKITELNPRPDFVIYSGDSPNHHEWEETQQSQMECTDIVVRSLTNYLQPLGIPVYPNTGNHEMYPTNLYYMDLTETQEMQQRFTQLWGTLANFQTDQIQTLNSGGYYSLVLKPGLMLLSINTNYWYTYNLYNVHNEGRLEVEEMWTFIEQTLAQARQNEHKVLIVGHHPVGRNDAIVKHSRRFRDIILEYHDVIVLHIAGHTHRNEFIQSIDPSDGQAKHTIFLAPSISTNDHRNPGGRVWHMDGDTFEVTDYTQYYLDLKTADDMGTVPEVLVSYQAKSEYGLADLSPASMQDFTNRMEVDDSLFEKHWFNRNTKAYETYDCDANCKSGILCQQRNSVYDKYLECVNNTRVPASRIEQHNVYNVATGLRLESLSLFLMPLATAIIELCDLKMHWQ